VQVDVEGFFLLRHLVVEQRHREDGRTLPACEAEAARHGGVVLARVRGAVPRLVLDAPLPVELLLVSQ